MGAIRRAFFAACLTFAGVAVKAALARCFSDPTIATRFMSQVWPEIVDGGPGPNVVAGLRANNLLADIVADLVASSGGVDGFVPGGWLSGILGARAKVTQDVEQGVSTLICNKVLSIYAGHEVIAPALVSTRPAQPVVSQPAPLPSAVIPSSRPKRLQGSPASKPPDPPEAEHNRNT